MHDFIGQPIAAGSWVAVGAAGNTAAEYGMILHWVLAVEDGKIKTVRLRVTYPDHKNARVETRMSTIRKGTKVVVVHPSKRVTEFYGRIKAGTQTKADHKLAGKWLHGQTEGLFT